MNEVGPGRGYWGKIVSARETGNGLWLNFGPARCASILVPDELVDGFLESEGCTSREMSGRHILTLGRLRRSTKDNLYICLEGLNRYVTRSEV